MVKIGLKLWNTNTDNYLEIAKELYQDKIFDYIELYVVPNNLDKIDFWKKTNIPFDIHAPHSAHKMNLSDKEKREFNFNLYLDVKKYADELNARYIVFHGGIDGNYQEVANQIKNFNNSRCLIENKPYKVLKFLEAREYIGTKPSEIKYIKDFTGCGFCLDIGHAICAGNSFKIDPYQFIDDFYQLKPDKIHLSDIEIETEIDKHFNFGYGNLDFKKLNYIFKSVKDITIETQKKSKENLDDFIEDVKFIRSIVNG